MEDSEARPKRDVPITVLLCALAVVCCSSYLLFTWRSPNTALAAIGMCCGVVYLVALALNGGNLSTQRRQSFSQILLLVAGGGWFAFLASDHLLRNLTASGWFLAVAAVGCALAAAWEISGMVVRTNESRKGTETSDPKA